MSTRVADDFYPHLDMVQRARVLQVHRLSETAAQEEIEQALFGDSRSGQGLCLIAVLRAIFLAIIFWLVI